MSILLSAHQLKKTFGARFLFEGLTFTIESGERIGLIGPNGAGKTTLLRILASRMDVDEGTLSFQRGLKIGFLEQVPSFQPGAHVLSTVLEGCEHPEEGESIARVHEYLSKLSLDGSSGVSPDTPVEKLSGGWKKRVALARECVREPDLFLLDEPTNHLDVESIVWLEEWLAKSPFATLTITHDRLFLQRVSNRIIELDRRHPGGLLSVKGSYADYLQLKEEKMAAQEQREIVLKNTLRQETEWLRRGPKARTTKQQARIDRAEELKNEVEEIHSRNKSKTVAIDFEASQRNPKKLAEAKGISKAYGDRKLFTDLNLLITPKSRIGLLGANGCGKSTLIRVLVGEEAPDQGEVFRSEALRVAYFEQNRETLDPDLSVAKTLCPRGDHVEYRGTPVHVRGYLDRFLFSSAQMEMPVGKLSGGEQSRLLIARLMLRPANLLVLDEPTNDLDMPTLRVLEECLQEFDGAILLVTHDRYFLDQVATDILAFPPAPSDGRLIAFTGLGQWENWQAEQASGGKRSARQEKKENAVPESAPSAKKKKLSYKDQREFDGMESAIQAAEERLLLLQQESAKPENVSNALKLVEITQKMNEAQREIERLYERWAELEKQRG